MTLDEFLRDFMKFGSYFCLVLAVSQFTSRPDKRHLATAILYGCVAMLISATVNISEDLHYVLPWVALLDAPCAAAVGPLMFVIVAESLHRNKYRYWPHFALPFATLIAVLVAKVGGGISSVHPFANPEFEPIYFVYIPSIAAGFYYYVRMITLLGPAAFSFRIVKNEPSIRHLFVIASCSIIAVVMALFALGLSNLFYLRLTIVFVVIGVVLAFLQGMHHIDFYESLSEAVEASKLQRSHLNTVDVEKLAEDLNRLVDEQIYLNPDLSLAELAEALSVSAHQLSEFLNVKLGQSFSRFINTHRVDAAKAAIKSREHMSLLAIGYQAGFNSKQSFIRHFKAFEQMTPRQYRAQHEKNS